jgi:GNAT superfamily N-acetyltransferase
MAPVKRWYAVLREDRAAMDELYTLRQATIHDFEALARLRWDFSAPKMREGTNLARFTDEFGAFLHDALASGSWVFFVAEAADGIIATITVQIIAKVPRPNRLHARWGYVTNVYTVPEWRDQGVGTALMQHVQAWATEMKLEFLELWPSKRAVPFYRRAGFAPEDEAVFWDIPSDE